MSKRKQHHPEFEAKVALEALERAISEASLFSAPVSCPFASFLRLSQALAECLLPLRTDAQLAQAANERSPSSVAAPGRSPQLA